MTNAERITENLLRLPEAQRERIARNRYHQFLNNWAEDRGLDLDYTFIPHLDAVENAMQDEEDLTYYEEWIQEFIATELT